MIKKRWIVVLPVKISASEACALGMKILHTGLSTDVDNTAGGFLVGSLMTPLAISSVAALWIDCVRRTEVF